MYTLGWFPVAALASCQKHSGLKQPKLIILLFYGSGVPSGSCWAKTNMLLGLHSFWKLRGESVLSSSPTSRGAHNSLAVTVVPSAIFKSRKERSHLLPPLHRTSSATLSHV